MLARDDAVQAARQYHDARHGFVRGLQHVIVVGVDGDVGVHIAVTGVHVQRHPHAALEHALVDLHHFRQDGIKRLTTENLLQRLRICVFQLARRLWSCN